MPFLSERFANPSGAHRSARDARRAVDDAREELAELVGAAGLEHPSQLRPTHIMMRDANGRGISFARSLDKIAKGALRSESFDAESFPEPFRSYWADASAERFTV